MHKVLCKLDDYNWEKHKVKKWQWFLLAVITYLLFLVAYTPASLVATYAEELSKKQVTMAGVSGSLFDGRADQIMLQGLRVNNVEWQLSPWSLLMLQANLDLKGGNIRNKNDIYIKGTVAASLLNTQAFNIQNTSVFVPTKTLLSQFKLPVFVTASGRFRVDVDELYFDQGCQQLNGQGNWLNAAINVNKKDIDFGTFKAKLSCETPAFAVQIMPDNKLALDAKLRVDLKGKYEIDGEYAISEDLPNEIKEAARFFGKPKGDGSYIITL